MKLRIRGNSIRLRVSKAELAQIAATGGAEDAARFAPGVMLRYGIQVRTGGSLSAELTGGVVRVFVPQSSLEHWLKPDEVSIAGEQALGGGDFLRILVEKDYTCLAPRSGEDDSDLFANPQKRQGP
jgi:hypothetical protein